MRVASRYAALRIKSARPHLVIAFIAAAAMLVFVDCMKELPATLLLRPLGFETLATHLYGEAVRGTYEDGAIAARWIPTPRGGRGPRRGRRRAPSRRRAAPRESA